MIYGIINAFIWAFSSVMYKKSLQETAKYLSDSMYQFLWAIFMLICSGLWYFVFDFQIPGIFIVFLLLITAILQIFSELLEQYAYKNEKISTLTPFWEFQSIVTILLWFIIFQDTSIVSFIFAFLAAIILFLWNINPQTFRFNKYCFIMSMSWLLLSIRMIFYGFILADFSSYNVFFFNILFVSILLFIFVFFKKQIKEVKQFTPQWVTYFSLENIWRLIYALIVLFLIENLWITETVLLWMLWLYTTTFIAHIFLQEDVSKKQLMVLFLVSICISIGMIYN